MTWRKLTLGEIADAGIDIRIETDSEGHLVTGHLRAPNPDYILAVVVKPSRVEAVGRPVAILEAVGRVAEGLLRRRRLRC